MTSIYFTCGATRIQLHFRISFKARCCRLLTHITFLKNGRLKADYSKMLVYILNSQEIQAERISSHLISKVNVRPQEGKEHHMDARVKRRRESKEKQESLCWSNVETATWSELTSAVTWPAGAELQWRLHVGLPVCVYVCECGLRSVCRTCSLSEQLWR